MTKANLLVVLCFAGLGLSAHGQSATTNPTLPSVPRADGTGPSAPSMSPAVGDIATPPARPASPAPGGSSTEGELNSADLEAAARDARKPGALTPAAANAVSNAPGAAKGSTSATSSRLPIPANARPVEPGPTVSAMGPIEPGTGNLDTTMLAQQIRALPHSGREEFLNGLEARLDTVDRELSQVKESSRGLTWDARKTYLRASKDVRTRSKALRQLLKEARTATPETWANLRATLATHYEGFEAVRARSAALSAVGR